MYHGDPNMGASGIHLIAAGLPAPPRPYIPPIVLLGKVVAHQPYKSPLWGSSPRPYAYEAHALPTELRRHVVGGHLSCRLEYLFKKRSVVTRAGVCTHVCVILPYHARHEQCIRAIAAAWWQKSVMPRSHMFQLLPCPRLTLVSERVPCLPQRKGTPGFEPGTC